MKLPEIPWPGNSDDAHCEGYSQKWLKLEYRMLCCIQQLIRFQASLGSCKGYPTIFPEPPVPAESDSSGLHMDKRWHKIITGWHVWIAAIMENPKLYLTGNTH